MYSLMVKYIADIDKSEVRFFLHLQILHCRIIGISKGC